MSTVCAALVGGGRGRERYRYLLPALEGANALVEEEGQLLDLGHIILQVGDSAVDWRLGGRRTMDVRDRARAGGGGSGIAGVTGLRLGTAEFIAA